MLITNPYQVNERFGLSPYTFGEPYWRVLVIWDILGFNKAILCPIEGQILIRDGIRLLCGDD